ncbi:MAG TPA: TIGR01906 family membrane protein [Clostridiales bacterium]|nr:TIGR01906 family membrane protein [Clostridiales bacterium]
MKKSLSFVIGLLIALVILFSSVLITLGIRSTYNLSMDEVREYNVYNLTDEEIRKNYNILIDYMNDPGIKSLDFIKLPQSEEARIHFMEVRNIFTAIKKLDLVFIIIASILAFLSVRARDFSFFKKGIIMTFFIPLIAGIPMLLNFQYTFEKFHKIMFSNDYWLFDPQTDPIIMYLPESLFFKNAVIILAFVILFLIILAFTGKLSENLMLISGKKRKS